MKYVQNRGLFYNWIHNNCNSLNLYSYLNSNSFLKYFGCYFIYKEIANSNIPYYVLYKMDLSSKNNFSNIDCGVILKQYSYIMLFKILNIIASIFSIILVLIMFGFLKFSKETVILFIIISALPSFINLIKLGRENSRK